MLAGPFSAVNDQRNKQTQCRPDNVVRQQQLRPLAEHRSDLLYTTPHITRCRNARQAVIVIIGTACIVCGAGSTKRYCVRPSVRPIRPLQQRAAGLLLWSRRDRGRRYRSTAARPVPSTHHCHHKSLPHPFIPGLKLSFSTNPSNPSLFFSSGLIRGTPGLLFFAFYILVPCGRLS